MALVADLDRVVDAVTIETAYTPARTLPRPFGPSQGGVATEAAQLLRPRLTFTLKPGFGAPIVIAPYGAPEPNRWPLVQASATIAGGLAIAGLVYWALQQTTRPRGKKR